MVLKVFYREENEAELKEILEEKHIDKNGMPLDRSCDLLMKKTDLERSQYKMVKSEACYDFLLRSDTYIRGRETYWETGI